MIVRICFQPASPRVSSLWRTGMETLFLVSGILVFGSGCLSAALASSLESRLIDEINERSPADQQVDSFRLTEALLRRHRELCPDSPILRQRYVGTAVG